MFYIYAIYIYFIYLFYIFIFFCYWPLHVYASILSLSITEILSPFYSFETVAQLNTAQHFSPSIFNETKAIPEYLSNIKNNLLLSHFFLFLPNEIWIWNTTLSVWKKKKYFERNFYLYFYVYYDFFFFFLYLYLYLILL